MQYRSTVESLTKKRDALQTQVLELKAKEKSLKEKVTADGFGGWGVAEERKVAMEKIRTKSDDIIPQWEALVEVAKLNKTSLDTHDENKSFEQLIHALMKKIRRKNREGVITKERAEDALKYLSKAGEPLSN
jgi:hypothetical protein